MGHPITLRSHAKRHPETIGREERYHGSLKLEHLYQVLPSNPWLKNLREPRKLLSMLDSAQLRRAHLELPVRFRTRERLRQPY